MSGLCEHRSSSCRTAIVDSAQCDLGYGKPPPLLRSDALGPWHFDDNEYRRFSRRINAGRVYVFVTGPTTVGAPSQAGKKGVLDILAVARIGQHDVYADECGNTNRDGIVDGRDIQPFILESLS